MLSSALSGRFFIQFLLTVVLLRYETSAKNVTFTPERISITLASLPPPPPNGSTPSKEPHVVPVPEDPTLNVPQGFTVKLYMEGLETPRYLLYSPTGDLLVSEPSANRISCLIDTDGDGYPDERKTFADQTNELSRPYGMAFANGYFYVASENDTRRFVWNRGDRGVNGTGEIILTYNFGENWTRTVLISPDNTVVYVSIGSITNVEEDPIPQASIQVANLPSTSFTTYAYGLRNAVGLAFHPITQDLYATCVEREELGDDLVPNFFTRVQQDDFYGWPYAYLSPNLTDPRRCSPNGTSERPDLVALTKTPDVLFQAHSTSLDMRFYTGKQFPAKYHNGAFAAFHGSWNRNAGTGYKIVFVPFDSTTNRPSGYYEDFVTGFLLDPSVPNTFGRPVGLLVLHDGSLIFTEDANNRIYQVQYTEPASGSLRFGITEFLLISCLLIAFFN